MNDNDRDGDRPRRSKRDVDRGTDRPSALPVAFDTIPDSLRQRPQWVVWRYVWKAAKAKWDKPPLRPDGRPASTTDPSTWCDFDTARAAYEAGGFDGVGYVFTLDDRVVGLDFDDCRDPAGGAMSEWAIELIERFPNTYAEVSPSGTGVKLFCRAELPDGRGRKVKYRNGAVEVYGQGRYFTTTGRRLDGRAELADGTAGVQYVLDTVFADNPRAKRRAAAAAGSGNTGRGDDEIIDLARRAANGTKFVALWSGDRSAYGSASEADLALVGVLSFYTQDSVQLDRLFRRSGMMRPKWDEVHHGDGRTYGQGTIDKALAGRTEFYGDGQAPPRNGQPTDGGDSPRDDWPEPTPLAEDIEPPPFPLAVLPAAARRFVVEVADALPCPPDYAAVPLLALAGAAVGASRALAIKENHVQRAALYVAVVGPPGSAKSPALDLAAAPAHDADGRRLEAWRRALAQHEADLDEWDGESPKPCRPVLDRVTVNDATAEALVPILNENPRGVMLVRDELSAWVLAMNQYREGGKGADVQFWLSGWSGAPVTVDRKGTHAAGPLRVPRPFVGVVGCLPPDKLAALRGDRGRQRADQDGFIDRVLFSYPAEPPAAAEDWRTVSEAARDGWKVIFDKLLALAMATGDDGQPRPHLLKLSDCGRRAWQAFTAAHAAEVNAPDFPDHLRGPWAKLKGYCGRLALVVQMLRCTSGEVASDTADVDGESIGRAAALVAYFKGHGRRAYAAMEADSVVKRARRLLHALARRGADTVTLRDAYRDLRGDCRSANDAEPVLKLLERHGYVRAAPAPDRGGPGRKPSDVYDINPRWRGHNGQNGRNADDDA